MNKDGFFGSALTQTVMEKEGKYYVYQYSELKNLENIDQYFEIKAEGNWENKIIF